MARLGRDEAFRHRTMELESLVIDAGRLPRPIVPAGFTASVLRTAARLSVRHSGCAISLWMPRRTLQWNSGGAIVPAAVAVLIVAAAVVRQTPSDGTTGAAFSVGSRRLLPFASAIMQPGARMVQVAGDFNGWNPAQTSLEQIDRRRVDGDDSVEAGPLRVHVRRGRTAVGCRSVRRRTERRWVWRAQRRARCSFRAEWEAHAMNDCMSPRGSISLQSLCVRLLLAGRWLRRSRMRHAPHGHSRRARQPPVVTRDGVRFVADARPTRAACSLAGSFNQWSAASHPLIRRKEDGLWAIVVPLPPGEHTFMYRRGWQAVGESADGGGLRRMTDLARGMASWWFAGKRAAVLAAVVWRLRRPSPRTPTPL